jgi:hypothetical protein
VTFRPLSALAALVFGLALSAPAFAAGAAANWRDQGPASIVMTYKVAPGDKLAFKAAVRAETLPRLQRLKASGELAGYHVLANRYLDGANWDVMMILDFRSNEALAHWRAVEDQTPGGLAPAALKLVTSAETAPSDLMFAGAAQAKPGDPAPVYLVVPYDYLVSTDEYLNYVKGYLTPQADGWIAEGTIEGYAIYLPRYPAGRPVSAHVIFAYAGDAGLARRDSTVRTVRARLAATSPEWKTWSDNKQKIRTEGQPVVADEIRP